LTYLLISTVFVFTAVVIAMLVARADQARSLSVPGVALAGTGLLILTAIFDNIMIGLDLFTYSDDLISGVSIGRAPIEDFAYPLATVVLLPALWTLLISSSAVSMRCLLENAFRVSRPISWINTAFPFAAAYLLVARDVDWILVVGAFYYLVPYNLAMYGINDVFDYESDARNPRKGSIEGALLSPVYHRPILWLVACSNLPFLLALGFAGSMQSLIAIVVSTFFMAAYSLPRLRFKERAFLDSVTSSIHFVSPAIVGLALAGGAVHRDILPGFAAFFCWGVAAHAFGAVQDIRPDREAGIGSIATVSGARWTVRFAIALWLMAGLLLLTIHGPARLAAIVVIPYVINAAPYLNLADSRAESSNRAWRRFIWMNYVSGFPVTLILIRVWQHS